MSIAEDVRADKLAAITEKFSGDEIEHAVNEASLLAVKEAIASNIPTEAYPNHCRTFLESYPQHQATHQTFPLPRPPDRPNFIIAVVMKISRKKSGMVFLLTT